MVAMKHYTLSGGPHNFIAGGGSAGAATIGKGGCGKTKAVFRPPKAVVSANNCSNSQCGDHCVCSLVAMKHYWQVDIGLSESAKN